MSGPLLSQRTLVLIESDWNLKSSCTISLYSAILVLIESDWNLKDQAMTPCWSQSSINRIRLEFKVVIEFGLTLNLLGINRIRLEFKGHQVRQLHNVLGVLIESDWNLKKNWCSQLAL